jgi:glutamate racemase
MMTIAIFDSGAGGLTVLKTFLNLACPSNFVYFADYQHLPYGDKKAELVSQYVLDSVKFLATKKIDALVVACNTATSLAIEELRNQSRFNFPIFGMEPAIKLAIDQLKKQKLSKKTEILITATNITANSQQLAKLKQRFSQQANFTTVVLKELVKFVENNCFDQQKINHYLKTNIDPNNKFDAIVLGCTHFSFFQKNFHNLFPNSLIVDGNLGTVQHVIKRLDINCSPDHPIDQNDQRISFYFSQKRNLKLAKQYQDLLDKLD